MGTVFDYLSWRGDLTMAQAPFSEVDALILSLLSYIDFEGIVSGKQGGKTVALANAAGTYFAQRPDREKISLGVLVPKEIVNLLDEARKTKRFRDVRIGAFVNHISKEEETQFCAMTFFLASGEVVVTYRGTDDTIVGWRENCNMSFSECVPAQASATLYLNSAAKCFPDRKLIVTGHSKGGNLATYATLFCNEQAFDRIETTYNLDGPGLFLKDWYQSEAFAKRRSVIKNYLPEHSIVGLLLAHDPSKTILKSSQVGILQHNGLSWSVLGNTFVRAETIGKDSQKTGQRLAAWIGDMTIERRREVVGAIFSIFSASNASTLTELVAEKNLWIQKCRELDPSIYSTLEEGFIALLKPQKKKATKGLLLGEVFKK